MEKGIAMILIAVFCRYKREFDELHAIPKGLFKRIRNIEDIRGIQFTGAIRMYDWYTGGEEMLNAHDYLMKKQPELLS
jgi:hypothetical protein